MRRLSIALAALLAAGCQVNLEGAACAVDGPAAQCPSGQACGQDGKCSVRAAECARSCARDGLVCGDDRTLACACRPVDDRAFHFDAQDGGAGVDGAPATGAAEPPSCRLGSLPEALSAANAAGVAARAVATGETPRTYALSAAIAIAPGVTLTTSAPTDPSRHVLRFATDGATPAITLGAGSRLEGFTLRNALATTGRAIDVDCGEASASVASVVVEGGAAGAQWTEGVHVGGACDVDAAALAVTGVAGAAVFVDTTGTAGSTLHGGELSGNGEGVHLRNGVLAMDGVAIHDNAKTGLLAGEGVTETGALDAQANTLQGNGDSGIVAFNLNRLRLASNVVTGNTGSTPRSSASRLVGGIVLRGNPPPELVFEGNVVSGNRGDQVIVYGTSSASTTWNLDPGKCDAPNTFGCYDAAGYGLAAVDCLVNAQHASWQNTIPTTNGRDFRAFGSAQIDAGDGTDTSCARAPACGAP